MGLFAAFLFILAASLLAYVATGFALGRLAAARVLDEPGARSSHAISTPRGGGLGLLAAIVPLVLWAGVVHGALGTALPLLAGTLLLAVVSFLDDVKSRPAAMRLAVQAAAVALGMAALGDGLVFQGILPFAIDRLAAAFLWLWFVNLYNFMDGIDGLTAVETIAVGAGIVLVVDIAGLDPFLALVAAALVGAALGFLPWNWPKARIFLGDVGSVPLGFLMGFLLLVLAAAGHWAAALALPLYYVCDATFTLLARLARGEKVWRPHREHAYQRAAAMAGHARTTTSIAVANVGLVLAGLLCALVSPWFLALAAFLVAALFMRLYALSAPPR